MIKENERQQSQALRLMHKIYTELKDPKQLLSAQRRQQLFKHTWQAIEAMYHKDLGMSVIMEEIQRDMTLVPLEKDGYVLFTKKIPFVSVLFPSDTAAFYTPQYRSDRGIVGKLDVMGPMRNEKGGFPFYGLIADGVEHSPILEHDKDSQVQHGGLLLDNKGGITFMDYDELISTSMHLSDTDTLVQGDWYIDNFNQRAVYERPNLQHPLSYNSLGEVLRSDGSRQLFAISSYYASVDAMSEEYVFPHSHIETRQSTMKEIAAQANVLAAMTDISGRGTNQWRMVGLELNRGGIYPKGTGIQSGRDHFTFCY